MRQGPEKRSSGAEAGFGLAGFMRGLKRLRKKALLPESILKSIPQGLKPTLILLYLRHD